MKQHRQPVALLLPRRAIGKPKYGTLFASLARLVRFACRATQMPVTNMQPAAMIRSSLG